MRSLLISLVIILQSVIPQTYESLRYEVRYKLGLMNPKVAEASVQIAQDRWEEKPALRASVSLKVAPVFRIFLSSQYYAALYLDRTTVKPVHYSTVNPGGTGECEYGETVHYLRHIKGRNPEVFNLSNDGLTMEVFSLLFFLRDLELAPGGSVDMHIYLSGAFRLVRVTMLGRDSLRYPGYKADCIRIDIPGDHGLMEDGSGNSFSVWRDSEGTRPLLGLDVPLKTGTMICNLIESYDI